MSQEKADQLVVIGASEHNLKNVSLNIPRDSLTVFTGVSGSGKSSLAFDTIFKEGQRRFVESLSAYARQFLGQTDKPKVEHVEGLSPTISVDQKTVNRNPRSTVGTITEIYDHYRLLFARLGKPHCPECGTRITSQTPEQITDYAYVDALNEACMILAPMVQERKGEYRKELEDWAAEGYVRARIDGEVRRLDEDIRLARYEKHSIELVVDRLTITAEEKSRFTESVEKALLLGNGLAILHYGKKTAENETKIQLEQSPEKDHLFSQLMACPSCQIALPEMEPRLFSFNAPQGACPSCNGIGQLSTFSEEKLCDPELSISEGAIKCFTEKGNLLYTKVDQRHVNSLMNNFEINDKTLWKYLSVEQRQLILYGNTKMKLGVSNIFRFPGQFLNKLEKQQWAGFIPILQFVFRFVKGPLEKFQHTSICPDCEGKRLNKMALAVRLHGHNINSLSGESIEDSVNFFDNLKLTETEKKIGRDIFREIRDRLHFLNDVGVGYLTLERSAATLSGGEGQRIRLASQLGAGLQGVLYVLDEPSIGLHQSDNKKLIRTLKKLRDRGNTVLVVEHDEETIESADHLVDIGPTAGQDGGHITAQGSIQNIIQAQESITGQFLSGKEQIAIPEKRRQPTGNKITIHGASFNNLNNIDCEIPLGIFVAVAGVLLTGIVSLIVFEFSGGMDIRLGSTGLTGLTNPFGELVFNSAFKWLVMLAPLGIVIYMSFGIRKMSASKAQGTFWIFASLMGASLASIFIFYTQMSIARVFFITAGTFGAMSIYGYTTKRDLTKLGSFLMMGLIGIIIASIVNMFMQSTMMHYVISILGVLIFVGLTAYDTQKIKNMYLASDSGEIMGKKAVMGALTLYLDFINLFIMLLRLFGQRR